MWQWWGFPPSSPSPQPPTLPPLTSLERLGPCRSLYGAFSHLLRLKNFGFKERSFVLDLPKPLLLLDTALRLVLPPYDTLSPQCRSFAPSTRRASKDSIPTDQGTNVAPTSGSVQPSAQANVTGDANGKDGVGVPDRDKGPPDVPNKEDSIATKVRTGEENMVGDI